MKRSIKEITKKINEHYGFQTAFAIAITIALILFIEGHGSLMKLFINAFIVFLLVISTYTVLVMIILSRKHSGQNKKRDNKHSR